MGAAYPSLLLSVTKGLNRQPFGGPRAISLMSRSLGRSHRVQGTHQTIAVVSKIRYWQGDRQRAFVTSLDVFSSVVFSFVVSQFVD